MGATVEGSPWLDMIGVACGERTVMYCDDSFAEAFFCDVAIGLWRAGKHVVLLDMGHEESYRLLLDARGANLSRDDVSEKGLMRPGVLEALVRHKRNMSSSPNPIAVSHYRAGIGSEDYLSFIGARRVDVLLMPHMQFHYYCTMSDETVDEGWPGGESVAPEVVSRAMRQMPRGAAVVMRLPRRTDETRIYEHSSHNVAIVAPGGKESWPGSLVLSLEKSQRIIGHKIELSADTNNLRVKE